MGTEKEIQEFAAKRRAQVERSNKRFAKMTKAQKRVQLAKDVLAQIKAKRLVAKVLVWVRPHTDFEYCRATPDLVNLETTSKEKQLQDVLAELPQCDVCALGSLFACAVERLDNLKVGELVRPNETPFANGVGNPNSANVWYEDIAPYLGQLFNPLQLAMMEVAFEGGGGQYGPVDDIFNGHSRAYDRATGFYCAVNRKSGTHLHEGAEKRLVAIMKNIIANDGTFKP